MPAAHDSHAQLALPEQLLTSVAHRSLKGTQSVALGKRGLRLPQGSFMRELHAQAVHCRAAGACVSQLQRWSHRAAGCRDEEAVRCLGYRELGSGAPGSAGKLKGASSSGGGSRA